MSLIIHTFKLLKLPSCPRKGLFTKIVCSKLQPGFGEEVVTKCQHRVALVERLERGVPLLREGCDTFLEISVPGIECRPHQGSHAVGSNSAVAKGSWGGLECQPV